MPRVLAPDDISWPLLGHNGAVSMIGRYELGPRIGAGSFATVYKAHDPALDVAVAIKVLAENWSTNQDVRQRFLDEARMLRRFQDPRIVRVHDVGTNASDQPYFVMDYADAGSLEKLRRQPPPPGRALRLCAEAARGIEVMHRHNIIHRDITPGNILLAYSNQGQRVMLADLGVAKSLTERQEGTMTAGTPAFMAYEQATGGWLDQRVDIYSMAAVTYSLLTGHAPFPIKTLNDLLARDWSVGVTPIADTMGAPPMLDELMSAALSPVPQDRPQSAAELADVLDTIAGHLPGGESYLPRPLEPMATAPLGERPDAPPPLVPDENGSWSANSQGGSLASQSGVEASYGGSFGSPAKPADTGSVTPSNETPASMLARYLPQADYKPAHVKERHSVAFYVMLSVGALMVLGLTIWLTISLLT